jgi:NAD(P)-dependent dehydrogenase (short-subunit alcohol dehydrogenase family)
VTGGASGITAATLHAIAAAGSTVVVVGRSSIAADEPEELRAQRDAAAVRSWMLAQALAGQQSPTPAEVEARVRAVLHRRSIRDNLARLRAAGARVEYQAVDVRDHAAFSALIESVYERHGRIDAVIHGAGVIEDKLIEDKTRDSFDRVFDTKVDAAYTLLQALRPRGLRFVALFSSTAGRFGNRGQADYAAANEVLNRIAWAMQERWPSTRVVAINWGPWAGTGMASEAINNRFIEQGILPIPVAAGSAFAAAEMGAAGAGAVEVVAGHGPWEEGGTLQRGARRLGTLFDLGGLLLHAEPGQASKVQ